MARIRPGTVGILPAGALGVSLGYHLTAGYTRDDDRVCFLLRDGSANGVAMHESGCLRIAEEGVIREVRQPRLFRKTMAECVDASELPEVVLVCTQPDQLLSVISSWVALFEKLYSIEENEAAVDLPVLVLASNGIYFQRVRQFLLEKLEESTLLGRLPDLWPDLMPQIVGRLMRGVTIQTGLREGSGADAIYRPGPRGLTRIAGGDAKLREKVAELLNSLGGWYELGDNASPTRVEFEKALVNLAANLLGQLVAIDEEGRFRRVTVGEILQAQPPGEVRELVAEVVAVGRAVHAYTKAERVDDIVAALLKALRNHAEHVPSSLQWIESGLRRGTLEPRLTPTEAWLLDPLIRYAQAAGVESAAHYFELLREKLERRIALAILRRTRVKSADAERLE